MAIGKRKTVNNFLPVLKYDARIGKFYLQDRVLENGRWETQQINVEHDKFRAVFDLENLQIGWIHFPKGAAPEMTMVPAGQDIGEPPSDKYREGVRVLCKMDLSLGGDVRELISTAAALWEAFDDLHDRYSADRAKHDGCLPAVDVKSVEERRTASGTVCVPHFVIAGWMPRPPELAPQSLPKAKVKPKPPLADELDDDIPF